MRVKPKEFVGPDEMAMLERVMTNLLPPDADTDEREWLASLLLGAFQAGTTDETGLTALGEQIKRR